MDQQSKQDPELQALCQKHLKDVPENILNEFAKSLFPVLHSKNMYGSICNNFQTYYGIKLNKNIPFDEVTLEIYKKVMEFGPEFQAKIKTLMTSQFIDKLKVVVLKAKKQSKDNFSSNLNSNYEESKTMDPPHPSGKNQEKNGINNVNKKISEIGDGGKHNKTQPKKNNEQRNQNNHDLNQVQNLNVGTVCLCGKQLTVNDSMKDNCFTCIHCQGIYHIDCMKKGLKAKNCSLCHLKKILPNRQVKKTLFLGVLKKGRKKHEIFMPLIEEDLSNKYKIQVRSFRIKESTQNFILFPDAVTITINSFFVKEFNPLHRQSSLKYRKDQPFYLQTNNLFPKQNKIVLTERAPTKQTKDDRIQLETHLFGIFLIEEKKVDQLVKEIRNSSITQFYESKKLLDSCFKVGTGSQGPDEITCQVVKIPLTCTLTIQKIKYPVRGVLCTHFQCFDLNNYLIMTSSSANPRWLCPLCKMPTYEFKLDCILLAILEDYKKYGATQVMFCIDGSYNVFADDKVIKEGIQTINQLPIESKGKRPPPQTQLEDDRKKKKKFFVPQTSNIISLDD